MYGEDSEVAAETEGKTRSGEPRRAQRSQGVNICFIVAALQPGDGLILVCRKGGTQTPPWCDREGAHLARVLKGHGVYICRNASPLNIEMICALVIAHVRYSSFIDSETVRH